VLPARLLKVLTAHDELALTVRIRETEF